MTDPSAPPPVSAATFASWGSRVGAAIVDGLPIAVLYLLMSLMFGDNSAGDGSFSTSLAGGPFLLLLVVSLGWIYYNWGVRQGADGQTVGKKVMNIAVYKAGTSEPLGTGLSIGRYFVHIIDGIPCYIGYLWPLWDAENRTFTDMILSTRVYKV